MSLPFDHEDLSKSIKTDIALKLEVTTHSLFFFFSFSQHTVIKNLWWPKQWVYCRGPNQVSATQGSHYSVWRQTRNKSTYILDSDKCYGEKAGEVRLRSYFPQVAIEGPLSWRAFKQRPADREGWTRRTQEHHWQRTQGVSRSRAGNVPGYCLLWGWLFLRNPLQTSLMFYCPSEFQIS